MIVIATDSTASLTKQEARQLGVIYIPMTYTVNGVQYTEKYEGDNGDFAALIESTQDLHTSQAAVGVYERTFRALRRAGFEVLCLTISSRRAGCGHAHDRHRIGVSGLRSPTDDPARAFPGGNGAADCGHARLRENHVYR